MTIVCIQITNVIATMLGRFEYLLLTATVRLGNDAYGAAIHREIESITGRRYSIGSMQITLDRLEKKGLLKTWMGDATPQSGGRARLMVQVNAEGVRAAASFYNTITQMSRGVSWEAR